MKLLFICTHNRCRSILAEAICNHIGGDKLQAASAGSSPVGEVHPLSLQYLQQAGISTEGLKSQSWDELESFEPDVVITVCDSAAGEQCPVWFGKSHKVHWGLTDPSRVEGSDEEIANAFRNTIELIRQRLQALVDADAEQLTDSNIQQTFSEIANFYPEQ